VPSWLTQQSYPYIDPEKTVREGKVTGETGNAQLNCLLYCEMVDNRTQPRYPTLDQWHGNFVIPTSNNSLAPDGTFALSYHHFLELYLLPRLQSLNQASIIDPHIPTYDAETQSIHWTYTIGKHRSYADSTDNYYRFKRKKQGDGRYYYEFLASLPTQAGKEPFYENPGSNKYYIFLDHTGSFLLPVFVYPECLVVC